METNPPSPPAPFTMEPFQWRAFKLILYLYLIVLSLQAITLVLVGQKQTFSWLEFGQISLEASVVISLILWIRKGPSQVATHVFLGLITAAQCSATFLGDPLLSVVLFCAVGVALSIAFSLISPPKTALFWSIVLALSISASMWFRVNSPSNPLGWSRAHIERLSLHIYTAIGLMISAAFLVRWLTKEFYKVAIQSQTLTNALQANNQELAQARDEALLAAKAKNLLLENVSHELRTPLNAIIGYAGLAHEQLDEQEPPDLAQLAHDLSRIEQAGTHLLGLVEHILDLTSLERGNVPLHNEVLSLDDLLQELAATYRPAARRNGNTFVVQKDAVPETIQTDSKQLKKLLGLLLENACKFTQEGHIRLGLSHKREGESDEGEFVFVVEDDGVGMTEEEIARAFETFEQLDMSKTKQHQGLGLGLPLAAQLAALLQGELQVQSTLGEGCKFQLVLPGSLVISEQA